MDAIPIPSTRTLAAVCVPRVACEPVAELAARLAARGPLTVLDGGNCFPAYRILRLVRACAPDPLAAMRRITIRRAFTCYQVLALLEGTPALPQPCLVLDPLASFYDEQVTPVEARRLLRLLMDQFERLSRVAPLLVVLAPPPLADRDFLIEQVCARAGQSITLELPAPPASQPVLF